MTVKIIGHWTFGLIIIIPHSRRITCEERDTTMYNGDGTFSLLFPRRRAVFTTFRTIIMISHVNQLL